MADAATPRINWTRSQTLAALHVYLQLPFGQLHHRNPKIKQLAQWTGRTPGSIALKLTNLASLDPVIVASGRSGMANASKQDKAIWAELQANWDRVALEAVAAYGLLASGHGVEADVDLLDALPVLEEGKTRSATVQVRCESGALPYRGAGGLQRDLLHKWLAARQAVDCQSHRSVARGHAQPTESTKWTVSVSAA